MSATGRSEQRINHDDYQTPSWCVRRLIERVRLPTGDWLEPAAGSGGIIEVVESMRPGSQRWSAVEIQEKYMPGDPTRGRAFIQPEDGKFGKMAWAAPGWIIGDFLEPRTTFGRRWDVAITNPPYSHAVQFLERMRSVADHVVLLLRLAWLSSANRAEIFRRDPPNFVAVLPNRPSFTGDGKTDATDYGWFCWSPLTLPGQTRIIWLDETPIEERRQG